MAIKSEVVILDEPTSNLDEFGRKWFDNLIGSDLGPRTLIIASNNPEDFKQCSGSLIVPDFRPVR
jgi:ABC-type multidrug transport system ATPase subunit